MINKTCSFTTQLEYTATEIQQRERDIPIEHADDVNKLNCRSSCELSNPPECNYNSIVYS